MHRLTPALTLFVAEMDNASDIINVEIKRGVKSALYLSAALWMTWLHPRESVQWRNNPQICITMSMNHAYSKYSAHNICWRDLCEGCVGEWMVGWVEEWLTWDEEVLRHKDNSDVISPNTSIQSIHDASLCKWKALTHRWKTQIQLDFVVKLCKIPSSTDVWSDMKEPEIASQHH